MEEVARKWIEKLGKDGPLASQAIYALAFTGIQVKSCQPGLILCKFVVPKHLSDKEGNWQVGAITALIDIIGAMAILSVTGLSNVSVQFDISYFSMAKISEEMEIESRVFAHKGKLSAVTVEIRKKGSGEMVALGNQWMSSTNRDQSKL